MLYHTVVFLLMILVSVALPYFSFIRRRVLGLFSPLMWSFSWSICNIRCVSSSQTSPLAEDPLRIGRTEVFKGTGSRTQRWSSHSMRRRPFTIIIFYIITLSFTSLLTFYRRLGYLCLCRLQYLCSHLFHIDQIQANTALQWEFINFLFGNWYSVRYRPTFA